VARTVAPYGSWASPFAIERLTEGVVFLAEPGGRDGRRWWLEGRPDEQGRQVLVRRELDGSTTRLTPEGFNARTRVHEYGGAATLVARDLIVVSDFATGRLHRVVGPEQLEPLTPDRRWRFADMALDAGRGRLLAIREDHEDDRVAEHGEWVNDLVGIDLASGEVTVLASGRDFYAAPRLSPDGTRLAWLEWDHPNLPWDGTELRLATIAAGGDLEAARTVAGGPDRWVSQPRWSPEGVLHFVSEPDGWMNLHRLTGDRVEVILPIAAEFAPPDWIFGNSHYGFLPGGDILAIGRSGGRDRLYRIRADGGHELVDTPWTEILALALDGERAILRVAAPAHPAAIVELDLAGGGWTELRRATPWRPDPDVVSVPRHVEFPTEGGHTAYGNFYAPSNPAFAGPAGELPPLVVTSHGGPTSQAFSGFATGIQLFTSRGYAVLDVDYGGSTGYGRAYRERLRGTWGITDVDDCVAGAAWLAAQGLVDGDRLAIRGGSASGYTTLAALAFRDRFSAGTTYFGIGDLRAFVKDTHKFESRYLEGLIGRWPEEKQRYLDRSPALHADRITAPVLVLQGDEDKVVPIAEAERIVDALHERQVPYAYIHYPGEDHGFRGSEAILDSFGAELSFYAQVFGFEPAGPVRRVRIEFGDRLQPGG
jgi:dipeptidyl aminopeptidase/acylaminoacyl peptidase